MKLYTDKTIAAWLDLTPRRVRQLRDSGVLPETRAGLWSLQETVVRYVQYLRKGADGANLNEERARLTKAKREAAELENRIRSSDLHTTADIEAGLKTVFLNIRSRFLSLPARLAPEAIALGGDQAAVYDLLETAVKETLDALSVDSVAGLEVRESEDAEDDGYSDAGAAAAGPGGTADA